ncbi:DNA-binding transcriptional LysR family regulator [Acidovorax soli]|uniref:DNA-binding transcriptional LysR family regulator n=1 Tax=Acidovorax soli TaxID=592050 RepID=A0A7X0PBY7_9BURK|nr:LysR family transcriptional regulator [Acidovorax soli]MBB6559070.1 DNA-binding transcriptional LysR family regulator [Acidovorax soli]
MDRFDGMRAFVRVVESGSFTRAADNLGWSRTTVTQLVQQLEARLQLKLLHRTTRRVNVTNDGAVYYERVVRLLAELDDIEGNLPGAPTVPRGLLRVDVPSPLANIILVPALPGFYARYPDIQLDMGASDRKVDLIGDNVDCVVRGGSMKDEGLVARHVGDLPLGVYAAPAYLAQAGTPLHPEELRDPRQRIVRYRWDKDLPYTLRRGRETVKISARYALAIDDGNAYLTAGLAGLGVLWLPHYMAEKHLETGALVPLFTGWQIEPIAMHVAYPPNRYVSKQLRVFIDWVVELMAVHAPRQQAPGPLA